MDTREVGQYSLTAQVGRALRNLDFNRLTRSYTTDCSQTPRPACVLLGGRQSIKIKVADRLSGWGERPDYLPYGSAVCMLRHRSQRHLSAISYTPLIRERLSRVHWDMGDTIIMNAEYSGKHND